MADATKNWFAIIKISRIVFFTIFSYIAVPLVIFLSIPIIIFRYLCQLFVQNLYWDANNILKIVHPSSQFITHDHLKPNPRMNIVYCWMGEGEMSVSALRKAVEDKIVNKTLQKYGKDMLSYPELKCYATRIAFYDYWKKIQDFDIKDYVKEYNWDDYKKQENVKANTTKKDKIKVTTEEELKGIISHLISKGWETGKSPWEFLVINNFQNVANQSKKKTVVIIRTHHFVGDGISIRDMLKNLNEGDFQESAKPSANLKRKFDPDLAKRIPGILGLLLKLLLFPFQVGLTLERSLKKETNNWKVSPKDVKQIGQVYYKEWCSPIPVSSIKAIKNKFGVSFAAVLNTIVAGTMRKLMEYAKQEVPDSVTTSMPIPLPKHPGGLCNHFGIMLVELPLWEEDPVKRLILVGEELKNLEKSTFPVVSYLIIYLAGYFPPSLAKFIESKDPGFTFSFGIFAFHDGSYSVGNCKNLFSFHNIGTCAGYSGAGFTACSHQGHVHIGLVMDQLVYPSAKSLEVFDTFVQQELNALLGAIRAE